jgi:uncharacterized membrane protein YfcA
MTFAVLFVAALWAGIQNALAGGGSFITLPSLMLTGMDARAANITSTVALFPAQLATGWTGRQHVSGAGDLSFRALVIISLLGGALGAQLVISIYGGYFGGGIGFLMLAALTAAGLAMRNAGATKNVLAGVMNASAVAIFVFSPEVHWFAAAIAGAGAIIGGVLGGLMLRRVNERVLRMVVVAIGIALTVGLFLRSP